MCCALATLAILGPRAAVIIWWLLDQARWAAAFNNFILPLLGFIFLPWTTLAYVLVWAPSGVSVFGVALVALAFIVDIGSYAGGAYGNRDRMASVYR